jgi:hypothetical protein
VPFRSSHGPALPPHVKKYCYRPVRWIVCQVLSPLPELAKSTDTSK